MSHLTQKTFYFRRTDVTTRALLQTSSPLVKAGNGSACQHSLRHYREVPSAALGGLGSPSYGLGCLRGTGRVGRISKSALLRQIPPHRCGQRWTDLDVRPLAESIRTTMLGNRGADFQIRPSAADSTTIAGPIRRPCPVDDEAVPGWQWETPRPLSQLAVPRHECRDLV